MSPGLVWSRHARRGRRAGLPGPEASCPPSRAGNPRSRERSCRGPEWRLLSVPAPNVVPWGRRLGRTPWLDGVRHARRGLGSNAGVHDRLPVGRRSRRSLGSSLQWVQGETARGAPRWSSGVGNPGNRVTSPATLGRCGGHRRRCGRCCRRSCALRPEGCRVGYRPSGRRVEEMAGKGDRGWTSGAGYGRAGHAR